MRGATNAAQRSEAAFPPIPQVKRRKMKKRRKPCQDNGMRTCAYSTGNIPYMVLVSMPTMGSEPPLDDLNHIRPV